MTRATATKARTIAELAAFQRIRMHIRPDAETHDSAAMRSSALAGVAHNCIVCVRPTPSWDVVGGRPYSALRARSGKERSHALPQALIGASARSLRYLKPGFGRLRCSRRGCFVCFSCVVDALPEQCLRRRRPGQARRRRGRLQITTVLVGNAVGDVAACAVPERVVRYPSGSHSVAGPATECAQDPADSVGYSSSTRMRSRLRNVGPDEQRADSFSANAVVSGRAEFAIASS